MGLTDGRETGRPMLMTLTILLFVFFVFFLTNFAPIAGETFPPLARDPRLDLLDTSNGSDPISYSDGTARMDPLDNLRVYRGGYNLTNEHYWSSTMFTGAYGYGIAVLWLLSGIVFGCYLVMISLRGSSSNKKTSKQLPDDKESYRDRQDQLWPVLVAFVLAILAILAVGLVLGGNAKFQTRARTVVNIIMDTANEATETIYNTTGAMRQIKSTLDASYGTAVRSASDSAGRASGFLGSTSQRLDSKADSIKSHASKNLLLIDKGLKIVYIITSATISMNLLALIALSVTGFLKLRVPLYWLIAVCWLLTFVCWILFGVYFFLDKFSIDTCAALENFQRNPSNNSLSSVLPCDEFLSANSVLSHVSSGIYNLVNEVNTNISHLRGTKYLNLFNICNPFWPPPVLAYQPDDCPPNTIQIGNIPKVLKYFTCPDADAGNCSTKGEFISTTDYNTVKAYTSSIQTLLDAYPGMKSLIECQSVKDALSEILVRHCGPLKRYIQMVWAALVFLGSVMVILVLLWSGKAVEERRRQGVSKYRVKLGSVSVTNDYESGSIVRDYPIM